MASSAVIAKVSPELAPPRLTLPAQVPLRGIGLIVASTVFFSGGDVIAKILAGSLPPVEVAWLRYVVFSLILVPFVWRSSGGLGLRSHRPGLQVLRGLGMVGSALFFISSLPFLPVADATAINFISPILITALAVLFLREEVGWRRWTAALVGLLGVLVIIRPGTGAFQMAALLPLLSASCWAGAAMPSGVTVLQIDPASGLLAYEGEPEALDEVFLAGTEPTQTALPPDVADPTTFMMEQLASPQ